MRTNQSCAIGIKPKQYPTAASGRIGPTTCLHMVSMFSQTRSLRVFSKHFPLAFLRLCLCSKRCPSRPKVSHQPHVQTPSDPAPPPRNAGCPQTCPGTARRCPAPGATRTTTQKTRVKSPGPRLERKNTGSSRELKPGLNNGTLANQVLCNRLNLRT